MLKKDIREKNGGHENQIGRGIQKDEPIKKKKFTYWIMAFIKLCAE